jgi:Fe-S-cluster containining protein
MKPERAPACVNCGKCCSFVKHKPFLTAVDVQGWLDKGLWHVLKRLQFEIGADSKGDKTRQQWTFQEDKQRNCVFRGNGKCLIYSVRPLTCQVYPVGGYCENKTLPRCVNKHLLRQFIKASHDFARSSDEWRGDKLKEIIELVKVKLGIESMPGTLKLVKSEEPSMVK